MKLTRFCLFDVDADVSDKLIGPHIVSDPDIDTLSPKSSTFSGISPPGGRFLGIFWLIEKSERLFDTGEVNSMGQEEGGGEECNSCALNRRVHH